MTEQHGGLRLPGVAGVGASREGEIHKRWSFYKEVDNYLTMELGMSPSTEPDFPCPDHIRAEDLTTTDSSAYTEHFARRTAWYGFLSEKKAEHDAMLVEIEEEMKDIETNIRDAMRRNNKKVKRDGSTKDPALKEMEDAINMSPRYIELKQNRVRHKEILVRLEARLEKLDREMRLTSRQVEIRRLDYETTNRNSSLAGRGGVPTGLRTPGGYGR